MTVLEPGFLLLCVDAGLAMLVLATGMAFGRLVRGPSLPDRVVALDFMAVALVSFSGLLAIRTGVQALLDIAVVLALIGFLATVALARYAQRRAERDDAPREDPPR